jgi:hypothetical protein
LNRQPEKFSKTLLRHSRPGINLALFSVSPGSSRIPGQTSDTRDKIRSSSSQHQEVFMSKIMTSPTRPIVALFIMVVAVVVYGKFGGHLTLGPTAYAGLTQPESGNIEVELITLRAEGFEPLQITRPKGAFVLLVDDRSGREGSALTLQRVKGERLRDLKTNRKKSEWYDLIDLPPGNYVLSDVENPERRCQITLLP